MRTMLIDTSPEELRRLAGHIESDYRKNKSVDYDPSKRCYVVIEKEKYSRGGWKFKKEKRGE